MEFTEGKCPKCQGKLQIPSDRESIICMYCGKEIAAKAAIESGKEDMKEFNHAAFLKYYETAKMGLPTMVTGIKNGMKDFKKNTYETAFSNYLDQYKQALEAFHHAYIISEEKETLLQDVAKLIISESVEEVKALPKERQKEQKIMDANMILVVYVIPAILEMSGESFDLLADQVLIEWKKEFPKTNLRKSTYENIAGGFRKKLCYITTAVCDQTGKPDDCHELNVLRSYRDEYLLKDEMGKQLVEEYYDIAPTIVKRISMRSNAKEIYTKILNKYITPCIFLIEQNELEKSKDLYQEMVRNLQAEFVLSYIQ
ncbi:MAG TPA: hypothetical protein IAC41_00330 [Candidatus Merdenecus merdavium]|nr:hypothetical protein [Candidatus Merdenecus merdavium]